MNKDKINPENEPVQSPEFPTTTIKSRESEITILTDPALSKRFGVATGDHLWSVNNNYGLEVLGIDESGQLWVNKIAEIEDLDDKGNYEVVPAESFGPWVYETPEAFADDCSCDAIIKLNGKITYGPSVEDGAEPQGYADIVIDAEPQSQASREDLEEDLARSARTAEEEIADGEFLDEDLSRPEDEWLETIIEIAAKETQSIAARKERVIIADEPLVGILREMLETIDPEGEVGLALIEARLDGKNRSKGTGLEHVLAVAPNGQEIILASFLSDFGYADDPRWQAAMAYPNVHFAKLPFGKEELGKIIEETKSEEKRPFDQLAIDLLKIENVVDRAKTLNHNLGNAIRSEQEDKIAEILAEAKVIFGDKDRDELINLIRETAESTKMNTELAGNYYPDLFVDIEGTLFDTDGDVNEKVLDLIKTAQEFKRRPVTIWTGGDVKALREQVRALGLTCKVTSKYNLAGAELETVVDDLPEEEFGQKYQVTMRNYINVNELV